VVLKLAGSRGAVSSFVVLQTGQGLPAPTAAGDIAVPWLGRMAFAYPTAALAVSAFSSITPSGGVTTTGTGRERRVDRRSPAAMVARQSPANYNARRTSITMSAETSRPALGGVECEDPDRLVVLAVEQVGDDGLKVGRLVIGRPPDL
jgi:hypothetical protein